MRLCIAALGAVFVFEAATEAQGNASVDSARPEALEEVIVRGEALAELRLRIERAEDDAYALFNERNSDDRFDIHCYERAPMSSRIERRTCLSNAWREADAATADAIVRDLQSATTVIGGTGNTSAGFGAAGYSHIPQQHRAKQLREQNVVVDEMLRLAEQDPAFREAIIRLGQEYQALEALSGLRPEWTLSREVALGEQVLPPEVRRRFDVRMGSATWSHPLGARAFTIAGVNGRIRDLLVACDAAEARLEYQAEVDWTIPEAWGACTLRVSAKRGTTFAVLELE
jgi:hypothetical protein